MTAMIRTILIAAAAMATAHAHGQITANFTAIAGLPVWNEPGSAPYLSGDATSSFRLSNHFLRFMEVMGVDATQVAPASGDIQPDAAIIHSPVLSVSGSLSIDPDSASILIGMDTTLVRTLGGVTLATQGPNFGTSGGSLAITNISIDLSNQGIYADVSGSNGLSSRKVRVWDYAGIEGGLQMSPPQPHDMPSFDIVGNVTLSKLRITQEGTDMFAQGLGLKSIGISALTSITDFGVMTIAVPEPSTYLMMGLGLAGVMSLAARRRRTI